MEIITPEIINSFLRAHLDKLSGDELVSLRQSLVNSSKVEELPGSLRENLHLRDYLLIRNLVEVILGEFDKLVPPRCSTGSLVTTQQSQWIIEKIKELKNKWWEQWKENDNNNIADELVDEEEEVSTPLLEYTHHLFSKLLESWRTEDVVITPKLSAESSLVTLVVEQSVLTLSKCKDEVGKWVNILRGHLAQVHFVAPELFYVDCGLDNATWQGVNILVVSKRLECSTENGKVWDVSGGPGENGGSLLFLCNKFRGLDHLKIITRGGNASGGGVDNRKPGSSSNLNTLISLFPPSAQSDSLRQLVFENAINHFGESTLKHFQFKPKDAYDPIEKQVTGQINDFYMEGETDYGVKFYLGFSKSGLFTKNAFCLLQGMPLGIEGVQLPGEPGEVKFFTIKNLEELTTDKLGVDIIAEKLTKNDIMYSNGGQDVGYVALNPKQVIKYPPGKYQLRVDDEELPDSVNCKLLGKFVTITDKIERVSSCKEPTETGSFTEPSTALEMYPLFESEMEVKFVQNFVSKHESEWWQSKILNDNN